MELEDITTVIMNLRTSPCAAVQMLACKQPRRLKINVWSDTQKLIRGSSTVITISVSNHKVFSAITKDGKYLVTSLQPAGKERNTELYFCLSFLFIPISPVLFLWFMAYFRFNFVLLFFDCTLCVKRSKDSEIITILQDNLSMKPGSWSWLSLIAKL